VDGDVQDGQNNKGELIMENSFKISWGIHNGTQDSRDHCEPIIADTQKKAINQYKKRITFLRSIGQFLWYANITYPKTERLEDGDAYR